MVVLAVTISFCLFSVEECLSSSIVADPTTAVSQTDISPTETTDTETQSLGLSNRLIENDFNIWINPSQITEYGTVYGEIWNAAGNEWGGATVWLPVGKLGIFVGRPYTGNIAMTGTTPLTTYPGTSITALPAGLAGPLAIDPFGDPLIYDLTPLAIGGNQIDILYGMQPIDMLSVGLRISLADNYNETTYNYSDTPGPATGDGSISNIRQSSDMQISVGALLKDIGPLDKIDVAFTMANPKVKNEFSESAYNAVPNLGTALDTFESENAANMNVLVRGIMGIMESRLIASLSMDTIDVSANRTIVLDNDTTVAGVAQNDVVTYKDTASRMNIDAALHTKPSSDLKVIYALGIANFSRSIEITQSDLGLGGGVVAAGPLAISKGALSSSGFPVTVALEHQTWKRVATRFSASKAMFSNASIEITEADYRDADADGVNDTIDETGVSKSVVRPRTQIATVGLGLGIAPAENVSLDIALQSTIFDLTTAGNLITRASVKYHF